MYSGSPPLWEPAVAQAQHPHGAARLGAVTEDEAAVDVGLDGIPVAGLT